MNWGEMKTSEHQMNRRNAMAGAQLDLTRAMSGHSLTAMEWVSVLSESMRRMIGYGLKDEWDEVDSTDNDKPE